MSSIKSTINSLISVIKSQNQELLPILQKGADPKDIEKLEECLGFSLPEDLHDFLLDFNGLNFSKVNPDVEESPMYDISTVKEMISSYEYLYKQMDDAFDGIYSEDDLDDEVGIKKVLFDKHWIPIFNADAMCVCYDLSPGSGGTKGQILLVLLDEPSRSVCHKSLSEFIEKEIIKICKENKIFYPSNFPIKEEKKPFWKTW